MLRRIWPVYARVLREALVDAISADEAALIAAALNRAAAAARASSSAADLQGADAPA